MHQIKAFRCRVYNTSFSKQRIYRRIYIYSTLRWKRKVTALAKTGNMLCWLRKQGALCTAHLTAWLPELLLTPSNACMKHLQVTKPFSVPHHLSGRSCVTQAVYAVCCDLMCAQKLPSNLPKSRWLPKELTWVSAASKLLLRCPQTSFA